MNKKEFSRQEEQVSIIIDRITKIVNGSIDAMEIGVMIRNVIQMREVGEAEDAIKKYISSVTGIQNNDQKINAVLEEIVEKPFQNNYLPFQNSILEQLKKDLERE